MGIDKIVKTRKEHVCICCGDPIKKGSKAVFFSERQPVYDADDYQIGIKYFSAYYCYDKRAVYGDNYEDGFQVNTMVPACQLEGFKPIDLDLIDGIFSIFKFGSCEHEEFKRCNVIEKCCDTCQFYKVHKISIKDVSYFPGIQPRKELPKLT